MNYRTVTEHFGRTFLLEAERAALAGMLVPVIKAPTWQQLHAIADAAEPGVRRALLQAVAETLDATLWAEVERYLGQGNLEAASRAIPWDQVGGRTLAEQLPPKLQAVFEQAGTAMAARLPVSVGVSFDAANPRAVEWVVGHSGNLVVEITESTRLAIRDLIEQGFTRGVDVRDTARLLRSVVGLTEAQAGAVDKFHASMIERGVSPERAVASAQRYAQQQLRLRAETIARTETMRASNEGQQELWRQADDADLLPDKARRKWIVTPDDRLCEICEALGKAKPVALEEPFKIRTPVSLEIMTPPAHPRCRCAMGLVNVGVRKAWERLQAFVRGRAV